MYVQGNLLFSANVSFSILQSRILNFLNVWYKSQPEYKEWLQLPYPF